MDESTIQRAVDILRSGGLIALPTETVYGLGADASNELAVRRIFAVKGRPATHPLIVHLPSGDAVPTWAREVPQSARKLAAAFWPGPLTMVLKRSERASDAVTGGQDTVALRVPSHPVAQAVLRAFGGGIAAPSANRFGRVSPTTAAHVRSDLGDEVDLVLDGGPCTVGVESTIVDLSGAFPVLLRPGGVAREDVERVLGVKVSPPSASSARAPGTLESHYAPRAGLVVVPAHALAARAGALLEQGKKVAALAAGLVTLPEGVARFEMPSDPAERARALYATLRDIDAQGYDVIVAALPPAEGLDLAVRDRLTRAAAFPSPSGRGNG
ncbi:MAG: L-threonylcarbamoyladenylate synthase [Myxococcota bacterium]